MTLAFPDSIMATHELVVPRSIPIMLIGKRHELVFDKCEVTRKHWMGTTYVEKLAEAAMLLVKALLTWLLRALFLISELNIVFVWFFSRFIVVILNFESGCEIFEWPRLL
jgi:hypothetical protein